MLINRQQILFSNKNKYVLTVNGGYGEWSDWTSCGSKCSRRTRSCNSPSVGIGGTDCDPYMDQQETTECNMLIRIGF